MYRALLPALPLRVPGMALLSLSAALAASCGQSRTDAPVRPSAGEEVNVGYGTADSRDLTSPVESVNEEELGRVQASRVEEMLEGRVSGLQVTRLPNGEGSLRIRGSRTFSGNTEPLVVVDGVPCEGARASLALRRAAY